VGASASKGKAKISLLRQRLALDLLLIFYNSKEKGIV
jgi:hypothetical protein